MFRAKDIKRKEYVAVKKLPHTTYIEQHENWSEVYFLSQCAHPNIVKFMAAYLVQEKEKLPQEAWISMEFLEVLVW